MPVTLEELSSRIDRIEKYIKTLIDVNLELIEEDEPENWEIEDLDERRKDEFLD